MNHHCQPTIQRMRELAEKYPALRVNEHSGRTMFTYLYADYKLLQEPCGKETRGIVFGPDGKILSRPFHKFFNPGEPGAPAAEDFKIWFVGEKVDGSLLQVRWLKDENELFVASRSTINPETSYVIKAFNALPESTKEQIKALAMALPEHTHLYELVDPNNQIVIFHERLGAKYIISRAIDSGVYAIFSTQADEYVAWKPNDDDKSIADFQHMAEDATGIEGWVVLDHEAQDFLKIKTPWYLERHAAASLNLPEHYLNAWADGVLDDYANYDVISGGSKGAIIRAVDEALTKELNLVVKQLSEGGFANAKVTHPDRKSAAIWLKNNLPNDLGFAFGPIITSGDAAEAIASSVKAFKAAAKRRGAVRSRLLNVVSAITNGGTKSDE